ncbi:indolethylamine N-methyltransferase-like [Hyla sarda]|uniref:indolethylamine N-methyltransferase-like n=1 Tax=Hyla sarda TaxID=327740 RepID=UPI0024C3AA56|nr:indolethylamine N-methyltransferase-like [Hyla sarda]
MPTEELRKLTVEIYGKFPAAERNYDMGNRELLAIKCAFEEWRPYLEGAVHQISVITDHKNFTSCPEASSNNPEVDNSINKLCTFWAEVQKNLEKAQEKQKREHLELYLSNKPDVVFEEDFLIFPMENLTKIFMPGHIRGDVMIDLSIGSMIHHLYAPSEFFKHIIVLKVQDRCILELKRWLNTRTGAFEWGHATKIHVDIEGKSTELQDKEGKVREAAQHVAKCDLDKENIMDPIVLPPADCITSAWLLDVICKDQDDYRRYLRKFSQLLKPGGHLILIGCLGMTYYIIGKDKFHGFSYDEDFARKALVGEGFVIDICVCKKATGISPLIDHKAVIFISAHKEK